MYAAVTALALSALAATPPGPLSVVARVNGVPLLRWESDRELTSRLPASSFHGHVSPERQAELRKESLEALVLKELKRQRAAEKAVAVDPGAVRAAWQKVRDRFPTARAYADALKAQGLTDAEFRRVFDRDEAAVAVDKATRAAVPSPTNEEARSFFEAHRAEYVRPEARRVALALVYVDPGGGEPARKAGEAEAEAMAARVRGGANVVDEAAKLKSGLPEKYRAGTGDIGFVHRGSILPELETEIFGAEVPSVRGPIRTMYGYEVVQVIAAKAAEPLAFGDAEGAVVARIRRDRERDALDRLEATLRKNARVERFGWVAGP